jgi:tartrate-resistant acid phosphatase type 5
MKFPAVQALVTTSARPQLAAFGQASALPARALPQMQRGTAPRPVIDLSAVHFRDLVRDDGQHVKIGSRGEVVIPELLSPGGIELPPLMLPGRSINIATVGDSGRGNGAQRWVAEHLVTMARQRDCNFAVHVGDMFYPNGLLSAHDPQLRDKFVECYGGLPNMHAILGNHEYGNSRGAGYPEAVLSAASEHRPGLFEMPQRYYSRRVYVDGIMTRMLFIDTSTLPVDPQQLAWLDRELAKSSDYTLVFGHHSIFSSGWHGDSAIMKKLLLPRLEARADLYVCGHDHNQQLHRSDNGLPCIISGAGVEFYPVRPWGNAEFASMRRGGAFLTVSRDGITYEALSAKKDASMYTTRFVRRAR